MTEIRFCGYCGRQMVTTYRSAAFPRDRWLACPRYASLLTRWFGDGMRHDLKCLGQETDRFDVRTGQPIE